MTIGNFPKAVLDAKNGKRYWKLSIGSNVISHRFFEGGWRAFEFVVLKKFKVQPDGGAYPTAFRIAFAFWLPFYSL